MITLLPTLPDAWPSGSVRGARARKGVSLDISWNNGALKQVNVSVDGVGDNGREVKLVYRGAVIGSFKATHGTRKTLNL